MTTSHGYSGYRTGPLLVVALAILFQLGVCPSIALAEKRVALIIGNAAYPGSGKLINPVNDAEDIAAALNNLDFDVTLKKDLSVVQFSRVIEDFSAKARGADVALFYFAGHALQLDSTNYLMPTDAKIETELEVIQQTIPAQYIVDVLERSARISLVFLDACRNNPLADRLRSTLYSRGRSASLSRGLSRISDRGRDTLIVYSAEPGKIAEDGIGRNSPFAAAVLTHIATPGLEVEVMLKRVTAAVLNATGNKQQPERLSRLASEFYFRKTLTSPPPPSLPPAGTVDQSKPPTVRPTVGSFDRARSAALITGTGVRALKAGEAFRECAECPVMVVIPAGTFMMGSTEAEYGHTANENPQHAVTISENLAVGKYEVTVRQFVEFLNAASRDGRFNERWVMTAPESKTALIIRTTDSSGPRFSAKPGHEDDPITLVSWIGAVEYSKWLSSRTGATYQLPSEAEWEYAARSGSTTNFHFGDDGLKLCDYGNVADLTGQKKNNWSQAVNCDDGYADVASVGSFQPNSFGLHDIIGNVSEWVEDCGHKNYVGAPTNGAAWISQSNCNSRMVRGGSFFNLPSAHRSAMRFENPAYTRYTTLGFRIARDIQP